MNWLVDENELTKHLNAILARCLNEEGLALPLYIAFVSCNGSVHFSRFEADADGDAVAVLAAK